MNENFIIVGGFVIMVITLCKLWSKWVMKQYEKAQISKIFLKYKPSVNYENLKLEGTGEDGNSDVEFIKAVEKSNLSSDVRIEIYD